MKQRDKEIFADFVKEYEDDNLLIPSDSEIRILSNGYKEVTIYNIYTEIRTIVLYDRENKLDSVMIIDDFYASLICSRWRRKRSFVRWINNILFNLKNKFSQENRPIFTLLK